MWLWLYFWTLFQTLAPWIVAATVAGVVSYHVADNERQRFYSTLAVAMVCVAAAACVALPKWRAMQLDTLRHEEAVAFCSANPVRVLKPLPATSPVKFGVHGYSYLGPGDYKRLDFALRSSQTQAGSPLANVVLVQLNPGQPVPEDVYPVLSRRTAGSVNLSVIHPRTGEIMAYSNYLWGQEGETRFRYVGCDRQPESRQGTDLETAEVFRLLASFFADDGGAGVVVPAKPRRYDIEPGAAHVVREDCSKGITRAPNFKGYDVRYLRDGENLVVIVLDHQGWEAAQKDKHKLALENRAALMWQHFHPAVTCKSYFADDARAGPILHAGGYEEPVARVRAIASQSAYRPFDFGPHRRVRCTGPIVAAGVRPGWEYVLMRRGNDLVIADYSTGFDLPTLVTPMVTCAGYFDPAAGPAPDVTLGAGGSKYERHFPAEKVLSVPDGAHLGAGPNDLPAQLKRSLAEYLAKKEEDRRRYTPQPRRTVEKRQWLPGTETRWPAKPRSDG